MRQPKKFSIGDRVIGKVHRYLTHIWTCEPIPPKDMSCSGVIIREMYNAIFLIKTDDNQLFACSRGYTYKPT